MGSEEDGNGDWPGGEGARGGDKDGATGWPSGSKRMQELEMNESTVGVATSASAGLHEPAHGWGRFGAGITSYLARHR